VAESAGKVGDLVAEIAAASSEQAQGIGQVNTAVTEMDRVTQQNAANAEESASASEEMNAQAHQMKGIVEELVALVGGAGRGSHAKAVRETSGRDMNAKPSARPSIKAMAVSRKPETDPGRIIPLDEDDFKDF